MGWLSVEDLEAFKKLAKIGIHNLYEAILYTPKSYTNTFLLRDLRDSLGAIKVRIKRRTRMAKILKIRAFAVDFDCAIDINIFHPKPFHNSLFAVGKEMCLLGEVAQFDGIYQINQPKIITQINQIVMNFPTTKMKSATLNEIFRSIITRESLANLGLESRYIEAIYTIFHPESTLNLGESMRESSESAHESRESFGESAESTHESQKPRESFGESLPDSTKFLRDFKRNGGLFGVYLEAIKFVEIVYYMQSLARKKKEFQATNRLNNAPLLESFIKNLPFSLTQGQSNAIAFLREKLNSDKATRCVVMGDVGCGKTLVILSCVAFAYPKKSILLAPTTILARQLYTEAQKFLPPQIRTALMIKDDKGENLSECDFLIGTHALLYRNLSAFDLFMTDEQHRFGTNQRLKLEKMLEIDGKKPHNIQFSATPIPRTMAMIEAQFIDFCFIRDLPYPKNIKTQIITREGFSELLAHIKSVVALDKQVAIIYPLVEQSEAIAYQSIEEGLPFWRKHFSRVFATHGKDADKEKILEEFRDNGSILVATTLFEVGISLPNLSTIVIVGAERLGFATLHQLRGRVSRNGMQGFCYLYTNNANSARLREFSETMSGFEIAELDLKYRNSGDILRGIRQSGEQFRYFDFASDKKIVQKAVKFLGA